MSSKEVKLSDCPIVSDIVDKIDVLEKDIDVNYRRIYYGKNDDEKITAILNSIVDSLEHHKNLLNILRSDQNESQSIYGF